MGGAMPRRNSTSVALPDKRGSRCWRAGGAIGTRIGADQVGLQRATQGCKGQYQGQQEDNKIGVITPYALKMLFGNHSARNAPQGLAERHRRAHAV